MAERSGPYVAVVVDLAAQRSVRAGMAQVQSTLFGLRLSAPLLIADQGFGDGQQTLLTSKVEFLEVLDKSSNTFGLRCNGVGDLGPACVRAIRIASMLLQLVEEIEDGNVEELRESCKLICRD